MGKPAALSSLDTKSASQGMYVDAEYLLAETTNKTLNELIFFVKDAMIRVRPCNSGFVVQVKLDFWWVFGGFLVGFWWVFALLCRAGCAAACSSRVPAQGALRARRSRPQAMGASTTLWECTGNIDSAVGMHREQPQYCGDAPDPVLWGCTDSTRFCLFR